MFRTQRLFPAVVLTALAAASIGFGASHLLEGRTIQMLAAERDQARDCRRSDATAPPCPVLYRNTRIEWRERIQTVQMPDRRQAGRIAMVSDELAHARRVIHNLELARSALAFRAMAATTAQNGSMERPYNTYDKCPPGSVVIYDAGLSAASMVRRSGDPAVCYVRTRLHNIGRLALSSQR